MKRVRIAIMTSAACWAAWGMAGTGYLPSAGPPALRFGPAREPALVQARAAVAAWPSLLMSTPSRVDPQSTNQPVVDLSKLAMAKGGTNQVGGATGELPPAQPESLRPFLQTSSMPEVAGWWGLLTNGPVTVYATNQMGAVAVPIAPYTFTPPEPPKSRATYSTTP